MLTRNVIFYVVGTAFIGLLLIAVALTGRAETRSLLIGESDSPVARRRIREALASTRIFDLKTLHLGPE